MPARGRLIQPGLCLALFLLAFTACSQDQAPADNSGPLVAGISAAEAQALPSSLPSAPDADISALTVQLRPGVTAVPTPARVAPPPQRVGETHNFTVTDLQSFVRSTVSATLRHVSEHAYWYVASDITAEQSGIESAAQVFETKTYPTDTRLFGDVKSGFDGDPRLTVLIARFNGAAGYYSSPDEYSRAVHPFSNERLMLYINGGPLRPGSNALNDVVAHELQHAIHWHADPTEDAWVNEGLSTLAEELNGYNTPSVRTFQRSPNVQLTDWEESNGDNGPHYAAAHLFMRFLGQHWGGYDKLKQLVAEPKNGTAGVDAYLSKSGFTDGFRDVFKRWVVANSGVNNLPATQRYDGITVQAAVSHKATGDTTISDQSNQYAAKYIEVQPSSNSVNLEFKGSPAAKLLPIDPPSGSQFWWSNRGDSIDSTLTIPLDLTRVSKASLRFRLWFQIEKSWDYAYVEASENNGATWTVLPGQQSSTDNPLGNSFGPGYTGTSGNGSQPEWIQDNVDLSRYTGKKIQIRFQYITDEGVNRKGLALDDIEVPEIGLKDDAEQERGWDARGFLRSNNRVAQQYLVQVVQERRNGKTIVQDLPLDQLQQGQLTVCCFQEGLARAMVVVAPLAPATLEPAAFQLTVKTGS